MHRLFILLVSIVLVIFSVAGFALLHHDANSREPIQFDLVSHENERVTEDEFLGKWMFVYFGFTNCANVCPTSLSVMTEVIHKLDEIGQLTKLEPTLISVDPRRDTPEVMKKYVGYFDKRISGLTGSQLQIDAILEQFNAFSMLGKKTDELTYDVIHSDVFFLVDPTGQIIDSYASNINAGQLAFEIGEKLQSNTGIL